MFAHWSVMRKRSIPSKWPRIFVLRTWSISGHRWHWNIYNLIPISVSRWTIIVLKGKKCPKMLITKKFFKQLFSRLELRETIEDIRMWQMYIFCNLHYVFWILALETILEEVIYCLILSVSLCNFIVVV